MDFRNAKTTFLRGGIHVSNDHKKSTCHHPIERFIPTEVTLPLHQHLGPPSTASVKRKDRVTRGDCIATGEVPVHSSVSGTVVRVALSPHPTLTECQAIVIAVDPLVAEPVWEEDPLALDLSKEEMLARIQAAGVVGLGGAAFPTVRKLQIPEKITIDTLIINGAECEPYLTGDHRLMLERTEALLWGATQIAKILNVQKILIGIEDNKTDAIAKLRFSVKHHSFPIPIEVLCCQTLYPQGSERQLIEALLDRRVPPFKLPMHVGVVVQNVATAIACYEAITFRRPLIDRVLTVSGSGIVSPKNISVPIGTLVNDAISFCGGMTLDTVKVLAGGPMMGRALGRLDVPIVKGTGGLILLRASEVKKDLYGPCISCGRCLTACPLGLEPNQISIYTEAGRSLETESFGTKECFECGCCAFVCPAERPLVQFIQIAKGSFKNVR